MKILIVNPFGIGDVLFSTCVVTALKKRFPDSFVGYLCNSQCAPVLENNPAIDKLFFFSRGDLKKIRRRSLWQYLKTLLSAVFEISSHRFDLVVDLSMVMQYSFMLWLIGVRQRVGFDYKSRGIFLSKKVAINAFEKKHVVDYYADLLALLGIDQIERRLSFYLDRKDKEWAAEFLKANKVAEGDFLIGVAPFGGLSWGKDAENKQWPVSSYADIAGTMIKKYSAKVIFFGAENNQEKNEDLNRMIGQDNFINAVGKTSLGQLGALIDKCSLFISNDSGPMHIACALGKNTVSVFGPVDDNVYGPVGDDAVHNIACSAIDCRPCYRDFKKPACRTMDCLKTLEPEKVLSIIEDTIVKSKSN